MKIQKLAAFCDGDKGGNPAGIVLLDAPLDATKMSNIAAEVGYSETAFVVSLDAEHKTWQVRYFSPESEVPFCGHATIALGAVLGETFGEDTYNLHLNNANISVEAHRSSSGLLAMLSSPPTSSSILNQTELDSVLTLFDLRAEDLNPNLPPARINGGADHIMIALHDRTALAAMHYSLDEGRELMAELGLVTIMLVFVENQKNFSVRNAFASGGVLEDPATGAAAAAFAGYLRDIDWPHNGEIEINQGEDMGQKSKIHVEIPNKKGSSVFVSGLARHID